MKRKRKGLPQTLGYESYGDLNQLNTGVPRRWQTELGAEAFSPSAAKQVGESDMPTVITEGSPGSLWASFFDWARDDFTCRSQFEDIDRAIGATTIYAKEQYL